MTHFLFSRPCHWALSNVIDDLIVDFSKHFEVKLKGTVSPKNDKIFKQFFLLLMKYRHVADVVVEFYSCAKCVKGLRGFERHYNSSIFKKYPQKNHSPEKFQLRNF